MTELLMWGIAVASLTVSVASLLVTLAAYRRLDDEASEAFAVIGADEGNHEARLERLETNAGLKIIPSPSALDELLDTPTGEDTFGECFADEHENTELQAFEDDGGAILQDQPLPETSASVVGAINGNY